MTRARKSLDRSDEDFFALVLLMYGEPEPNVAQYVYDRFQRGVTAYLTHDPRGRKFTECVVQCGEAKARKGKLYYRYVGWYRKKEKL